MATPPLILDRNGAAFERHTYRHDGLNLVAWITRPPGPGPFPLLVQNHGSGISMSQDGALVGDPSRPTIDPANAQQMRLDAMEAILTGFEAAPSAPSDPPEQWTALDFLLPGTLRPDAARWAGRFGTGGPDAMVVLDGEHVAYAWKDDNSRSCGEGTITHRSDALHVEPWPGVSLLLEPLPGNALQVTYEGQGERSVAHLDPVGR